MGNKSATSCLSAEPHDDAIKDPLVHYFGCTQFRDRSKLLDPKHKIWIDEKTHQRDLEAARHTRETEIERKAEESVKAIRERWGNSFNKELWRIEVLRKALEEDESDRNLVREVNECRKTWQNPPAYKKVLADTQKSPTINNTAAANPSQGKYVPEKDVSVGIIQFENSEPFNENCEPPKGEKGPIWGKFPDQKSSVQSLLREGESNNPDQNLLHRDRIPAHLNRIRYFHIPSNNMIWAEEAISRYFGESKPDFASFEQPLRRKDKTRSAIILGDRYWRGQLHADERDPPHTRYMSPICETISSKSATTRLELNNMVLFMPYLHWETSKKRGYFASEMDHIMAAASKKKKDEEEAKKIERTRKEAAKRIERIKQRKRPDLENKESEPQQNPSRWDKACIGFRMRPQTLRTTESPRTNAPDQNYEISGEDAIYRLAVAKMKRSSFQIKKPLAKYLMAVSKLHEAMANFRDKMLLRKYLPENPPLHPRRTLDQAFYWALKSTKKRDRDQVVFRGTTAKPDDFHRFDLKTGAWPKHDEYKIQGTCLECTANIQKLSRVVMVDQLWMWILDAKTIITCFPKRYGANKNDASGIHKCIRSRVKEAGSVHTVFELGLIILDECSKTFFDRTKTLDRRPQVINEFSRAIGHVMHQQTAAFHALWWWTEQVKLVYCAKGYADTSNLHTALLDINPEGRLDREIEDIIEELDILLHLSNTHNGILNKFVEQAEHILDPDGVFKRNNDPQQQHIRAKTDSSLSDEDKEREKAYKSFKQKATEGQARAVDYIRELEKLRENAKKAADDVLHLLSMKQQQASVFQAWQAMKQSDETIKQGRSIMTFTLVTIVFLPLSFLSSVFGMNNQEFGENTWSISRQIRYIFSISAGVVFLSLLFAFSSWIRACIWWLYVRFSTAVAVRFGLYDFYLHRPTKRISEDAADRIYRAKRDKQREYLERRFKEQVAKEKREKARLEAGPEQQQKGGMIACLRASAALNRSRDLESQGESWCAK
ncbi:hypothetical protein HD806DRAFT_545732 [Xylariaceae sp. AK1471]|nr:hypothetical protein HD806DRAFT_545732 [Xylariaceae sp. AK1471]